MLIEGFTGAVGAVNVELLAPVPLVTEVAYALAGGLMKMRLAKARVDDKIAPIARPMPFFTDSKLATEVFTINFDQGLATY